MFDSWQLNHELHSTEAKMHLLHLLAGKLFCCSGAELLKVQQPSGIVMSDHDTESHLVQYTYGSVDTI